MRRCALCGLDRPEESYQPPARRGIPQPRSNRCSDCRVLAASWNSSLKQEGLAVTKTAKPGRGRPRGAVRRHLAK